MMQGIALYAGYTGGTGLSGAMGGTGTTGGSGRTGNTGKGWALDESQRSSVWRPINLPQ